MGDTKPESRHDPWARWTYERLCVQQPHIETGGIWQHAGEYYIACPKLSDNSRAADGTPLRDWFDSSCRPFGIPIRLVAAAPQGAQEVPQRTLEEAIELAGDPLTTWQLLSELSLRLPRTFPLLGVEDGPSPMTVKVCVSRDLTSDDKRELDAAIASLQQPYAGCEIEVQTAPKKPEPAQLAPRIGLPELVPSRLLFRSASGHLRSIYEEDEDFWSTNRVELLRLLGRRAENPDSRSRMGQ